MVYVELIVLIDLFMNYLVITSTGIILNRISSFKKMFLSSVIGCIPLIFLYIDIGNGVVFLINIVFSIIMVVIAFNYKDILYTIKNIIYMYFVSIFLAGSLYLINTTFLNNINSQFVYIIILLISSPIITYIYMKSLKK